MTNARFTPDDLGALGQDDIARLCTREKLIANQSIRDRTGWDYRVEFPNADLSSNVPLDQRPSPLPMLVQVKAVYASSNKVTLKLRTFERLMKAHEPAFIFIPIYSRDNELHELCAIHLVGAALEKSLERLAALSETKGTIGESDTISFSRQKWWSATSYPKAGCLREFLSASVEAFGGRDSYTANKTRELQTLGYERDSHIVGRMTLVADSEDEIVEGMLGLRQLKASQFAVSDRRFGIERLLHKMEGSEGTVTIAPAEMQPCLLRILDANGSRRGDVAAALVSPGIRPSEDQKLRFLVYVEELQLDISLAGTLKAHLSGLDKASHPVGRWIDIFDVLDGILSPGCKIELLTPNYQRAWGGRNLTLGEHARELVQWCHVIKHSAASVRLVFERANLLQKAIDFETIADNERTFAQVGSLLSGPDISFSIGLNVENSKLPDELFSAAHGLSLAGWIDVNRTVIAYVIGAKARLKVREGEYSLDCSTTGDTDVSVVGDAVTYASVIEGHYRRNCSKLRISADVPDFTNSPSN